MNQCVPTPKISSSRGVTDDDSDDGDVGDDDDDDNDHDSWTNVSPPQKSPLQGEWLAHTLCEGRFGCWTPAAANSWNPATQCFWLNFVHFKVRRCFAFKQCVLCAVFPSMVQEQGGIWPSLVLYINIHLSPEKLTRGGEVWWGYRGCCGGGSKVAYHSVVTMYTTHTTPHVGWCGRGPKYITTYQGIS